jgi:hypothetical protein
MASSCRPRQVNKDSLHAPVDLAAEGPHPLQVIAWEAELPVLLAGGAWGQRWAGGVAAHGDDQVGVGQQFGGDRLGRYAGQADAAFGQRGGDNGTRVSAGSVPAESARTPGGR